MKSLNGLNARADKPFAKPAIRNSLGQASKVSKSARKRQHKKERANLAGQKMDSLLTSLPSAPDPAPLPRTAAEMTSQKLEHASQRRHHSRRAEQKVAQHEISSFAPKTLNEIRAKIMQHNKS